jgi:hypothetical protein
VPGGGIPQAGQPDAVSLRVTVALRLVVTDPVAYVEAAAIPSRRRTLAAQISLRNNGFRCDRRERDAPRRAHRRGGHRSARNPHRRGRLDVFVKTSS